MVKKKVIILMVLGVLFVIGCNMGNDPIVPEPDVTGKTYGGSLDENINGIFQIADNNLIVVGSTTSYGNGNGEKDVYLLKLNQMGDVIWTKTFGGSGKDYANSMIVCNDGGYLVLGVTDSFGNGGDDFYLIKTDQDGNEIWSKTYGEAGLDWGNSVKQTTDGGYILCGASTSYNNGIQVVLIIKIDLNGNEIWRKIFQGTGREYGDTILQTRDGGYIISGTTGSDGNEGDVFLLKIDSNGNQIWRNNYGGNSIEFGHKVIQTNDDGFFVVGVTTSYGAGGWDGFLVRTDSNGNELWYQTYGGNGEKGGIEEEAIPSIIPTEDGNYLLTGTTNSFGAGGNDVFLVKIDNNGNEIWRQTYGGVQNDFGSRSIQLSNGQFVVGGHTHSFGSGGTDIYLIKTDRNGAIISFH